MRPARWLLLTAAVGCAAALGAVWQFRLARAAFTGQWEHALAHRTAGLAALAVAMLLAGWVGARATATPQWRPRPGLILVLLCVLVFAAGVLRFHRLHELPPGLWIDEALNGVQAIQIAQRGWPLIALPPEDVRTGLGAGFVNVAALPYAFGDPEDGPWTLRATAAVLGTIAVAAAAVLAWLWFGPLAALVATAWLAVSHWHLNYSRWGEMPIMSPLIETLVAIGVTCSLRATGARAWVAWLLAGVAFGAGTYTYQTYRLWAAFALLAGALAAFAWRDVVRRQWRSIVGSLGVAAAVAAPMVHYALTAPDAFGERAAGTVLFLRDDWAAQLAEAVPRTLLAFQYLGDDNARHNLPFAPLLGVGAAVLAPLGLAVCVGRWRRPVNAAAVLWFAVALVPGMVTLEAPHATRLLDASVPLALFVGVAVAELAGLLVQAAGRRTVRVAALVALLAAVGAALEELHTYFVARERLPEFTDAFYPHESAPARHLARHRPEATVYLDPVTYWHPALPFVARQYLDEPHDVRLLRLQHDLPPREPPSRDALYLLPQPYASVADALRAMIPATRCTDEFDRFGRIVLRACHVPQAALTRLHAAARDGIWRPPYGLRARFWSAPPFDRPPDHDGFLPYALCEYELAEPPLGRFARAVWDGTIDVPRAGEYLFRLNPDTTTLEIAGQRVIEHAGAAAFGGGHEGRVMLDAGRHPIRITLEPGATGPTFLWFFWQPPGEAGGWVPATALRPPPEPTLPTRHGVASVPESCEGCCPCVPG